MNRFLPAPAALGLVTGLLLVAGCGDPGVVPTEGPAASSGAAAGVFTIGMSQCNLGEPWRVQMNADIKKLEAT